MNFSNRMGIDFKRIKINLPINYIVEKKLRKKQLL